ncbi:MAG: lumazine-binding family protein [Novosphingobium sp.]|nr:lumazine-binding family protein [Novosphingobium sp.]
MRKTIEQLLAEAAIKDVQIGYCRGADRMDLELMRSCFHSDAKAVFFGEIDVEAFLAMAQQMLPNYTVTTHNTGNQLVQVDGDTAFAEHYTIATHRIAADSEGPERDFVTAVRYADRFDCREGDWRISRRVLIVDWVRTDPVLPGPGPKALMGQRGRGDPSYSVAL